MNDKAVVCDHAGHVRAGVALSAAAIIDDYRRRQLTCARLPRLRCDVTRARKGCSDCNGVMRQPAFLIGRRARYLRELLKKLTG